MRKPPAIAPMVARQASNTATNPGMDALRRRGLLIFRQRAETYATTKPMLSAGKPDCFWVPTTVESGGIAAACSPGGSWPGRSFRSPNSSDQDVASPYRPLAAPETQDVSINGLGAMRNVRSESKTEVAALQRDVCFSPDSRHSDDHLRCRLCANSRRPASRSDSI